MRLLGTIIKFNLLLCFAASMSYCSSLPIPNEDDSRPTFKIDGIVCTFPDLPKNKIIQDFIVNSYNWECVFSQGCIEGSIIITFILTPAGKIIKLKLRHAEYYDEIISKELLKCLNSVEIKKLYKSLCTKDNQYFVIRFGLSPSDYYNFLRR